MCYIGDIGRLEVMLWKRYNSGLTLQVCCIPTKEMSDHGMHTLAIMKCYLMLGRSKISFLFHCWEISHTTIYQQLARKEPLHTVTTVMVPNNAHHTKLRGPMCLLGSCWSSHYRSVPGKRPWALATQPPKIGVGGYPEEMLE